MTCCCPVRDARRCIEARYGHAQSSDEPASIDDGPCECACHDDDEEDDDEGY